MDKGRLGQGNSSAKDFACTNMFCLLVPVEAVAFHPLAFQKLEDRTVDGNILHASPVIFP
jgi:hypothetical protein